MTLIRDLLSLDQRRCWEYILNAQVCLGKPYLNPTRVDKLPGCKFILSHDGAILLHDHSRKETYNCVSCWAKMKGMKYWDALDDLCRIMPIYVSKYPQPSKSLRDSSRKSTISIEPKVFNQEALDYWGQREVGLNQLERCETSVEQVLSYTIAYPDGSRMFFPKDLCFAYHFHNGIKLYFPNRAKPRFKSSTDRNSVWLLKRGSETLFVAKANKDLLVVENLCDYDLLSISNEGSTPDILWKMPYKQIILGHDPDEAGLLGANKVMMELIHNEGIPTIHLHTGFLEGIKDWDEMVVKKGLEFGRDYFQNKVYETT